MLSFAIAILSSLFFALSCNAYIPTNLVPSISHLESIVSSNAIITSFIGNLRNEITFERVVFQVFDFNLNSHNMYIFSSLLLVVSYGQWKYYDAITISDKINKFRKIDKYSRIEKTTKEILFLIAFLFVKDVQSVY